MVVRMMRDDSAHRIRWVALAGFRAATYETAGGELARDLTDRAR